MLAVVLLAVVLLGSVCGAERANAWFLPIGECANFSTGVTCEPSGSYPNIQYDTSYGPTRVIALYTSATTIIPPSTCSGTLVPVAGVTDGGCDCGNGFPTPLCDVHFSNVDGQFARIELSGALTSFFGAATGIEILPPKIEVTGSGGVAIASGASPSVALGTRPAAPVDILGPGETLTFTVANVGAAVLTLDSAAADYLDLTGPHAADFTVTAPPALTTLASVLGGGASSTTFTVTAAPSAVGLRSASLTLPSDDPGVPSFTLNLEVDAFNADNTAPTLSASASGVCGDPARLGFELIWSEPVIGLTADDIALTAATVTAVTDVTGSGDRYQLTAALSDPSGAATDRIDLTVAAGAVIDAAGNVNAQTSFPGLYTCTNPRSVRLQNAETSLAAAQGRAATIRAAESQIRQRMTGESGGQSAGSVPGELSISVLGNRPTITNVANTADNHSDRFARAYLSGRLSSLPLDRTDARLARFDTWVRGSWQRVDDGDDRSEGMLLAVGLDRRINDQLLLGLLGQIDGSKTKSVRSNSAARGWMLGPYAVFRPNDSLTIDGRVAWGRLSSDIDAGIASASDISARRFLGRVQISGALPLTDWMTVRPEVRYLSYHEWHESYRDNLDVLQPARHFVNNALSLGPRVEWRYRPTPDLAIHPYLGLYADWRHASALDAQGGFDGPRSGDWSSTLEAGFRTVSGAGWVLEGEARYGGWLGDQATSYGAALSIRVPF